MSSACVSIFIVSLASAAHRSLLRLRVAHVLILPTRAAPAPRAHQRRDAAASPPCQHTSAYVSIRQHTPAYTCAAARCCSVGGMLAYVSIRQHTPTSAYATAYATAYASKNLRSSEMQQRRRHADEQTPALRPGFETRLQLLRCQSLYFCASKASKLSTCRSWSDRTCVVCDADTDALERWSSSSSAAASQFESLTHTCCRVPAPSAYVSIRQHTSAYAIRVVDPHLLSCTCPVSIRSAYVSIRNSIHRPKLLLVYLPRQHTSAYVSIRQHTSAYVSIRNSSH
jgi:hypothetical protein